MRRPLCLEQSEQGGERGRCGGLEGTGRSCMALWTAGRTWALTRREVRAGEGLWAEERLHLTHAHKLPLMVAVGRRPMGGRQEPGWAVYITVSDSGGGGAA